MQQQVLRLRCSTLHFYQVFAQNIFFSFFKWKLKPLFLFHSNTFAKGKKGTKDSPLFSF